MHKKLMLLVGGGLYTIADLSSGDYFRRMKAKGGNRHAMVATASKMAAIYYKMVLNKVEFNPSDLKTYQQKYKQAKITYLERKLDDLKRELA
jgi:transposase